MPSSDSAVSFDQLRQRAEAQLRQRVPATGYFTPAQVQALLLELETHQVELQMQQEMLLEAYAAAEQARAAAERAHAEYVDLYEQAPVAFVTLSAAGLIERVNQQACQLLGTDAGQLVARRFLLFVAPPSRAACANWLAGLRADEAPRTTQLDLLTHAGASWPAQLEALAGPEEAGGKRSCRVVLLDLSAQRAAAAALHQSQERTRLALAVAGAGVVEWDCTKESIFLDERARTLFGWPGPPAHLPLAELQLRVLPADRPALAAALERAAAGQSLALDFRVSDATGGPPCYLMAHGEVVFAAGQRGQLMGLVCDVTAHRQALAEAAHLRQSQQQAIFAAVLTTQEEERRRMAEALHNGVGQLLYLLKLQLEARPDPTSGARDLLAEAIRDVRAVSAELTPPVLEDFGLQKALEALGKRVLPHQLRVRSTFEDLPAGLPKVLETIIYRIVQELLTNVLRHARAEEVFLHVGHEAGHITISVDDDGQGFAPLAAGQAAPGLGLAGLRGRVTLLGGTLQVISQPGAGTSVSVELPIPPSGAPVAVE